MLYGVTRWQFEGQEIFKRAVQGMASACEHALGRAGFSTADVELLVPHQANLRIIEAVARRAHVPMERVYVNVQRYGNMSAATVPVALCEALEEGRVRPGALLLMPGFGGGLSYCAQLVRWGRRVTPLAASEVQLPPNDRTALEIIRECRERKTRHLAAATAEPFAHLLAGAPGRERRRSALGSLAGRGLVHRGVLGTRLAEGAPVDLAAAASLIALAHEVSDSR